jgi:hypothetical protein
MSAAGERRGSKDRTLNFKQGHEFVSRRSPDVVCFVFQGRFSSMSDTPVGAFPASFLHTFGFCFSVYFRLQDLT